MRSAGRPLRVLFVNENIGGHATVHHHLRAALRDHDDVDATFYDVPPPSLGRRLVGAAVPGLARLDADLQPLRAQLASSLHVARRLRTLAADADVVHLYTQNAGLLSTGVLRRTPSVVSLDTTNEHNAFRLPYRAPTAVTPLTVRLSVPLERRVFDAVDRVVANSEWAASSLRTRYGVADDKLEVFPFGIAGPPRPLGHRPPRLRPRVTFIGRQFERKGGSSLLRVFQRSFASQAELVIVSPDPVVAGSTLGPSVRVVSDLAPGDDRLWEILADSDVFAFPSPIDQAPNVVLEAMAAGLPVVAVGSAGMAEMVDDGVTGRLVPPSDDAALHTALDDLIRYPEVRAAMGHAGRQRFEDRYDVRVSTARLVALLDSVAGGGWA